ncbi:MAG: response regulator [Campylobacterales bacterium]|nr:response regulator [Campylobacterales bacterium]
MPKMDGLEMLRQIKELSDDFLAVVTTAHGESDYYQKAFDLNVHGYLLKPLQIDKLLALLGVYKIKF